MPAVRMIDAVWAGELAVRLEREGHDAGSVLASVGLDARRVRRKENRIPYFRFAALLEAASTVAGDPCFGLNFASTVNVRDMGLLAYVGLSSATLGAALRNMLRYIRVFNEGLQVELAMRGETVELRTEIVDRRVQSERQLLEFSFRNFRRVLEVLAGQPVHPQWVTFRHNRSGDIAAFERAFGAPVQFGCETAVLAIHRRHMATPVATADHRLLGVLRSYCEEILAKRHLDQDLTHDVARHITSLLPSGRATLDIVAAELGMSKRTLSRRLAEHGTSFAACLDTLRKDLALRYLDDSDFPLGHIAYLLGYSEVSAFNHAFRRWTGTNPTRHRTARQEIEPTRPAAA